MQPLLLWKQTLESPFDPGPLLLDGPNVRFTSADQFLPHGARKVSRTFSFTVAGPGVGVASLDYRSVSGRGIQIDRQTSRWMGKDVTIWPSMEPEETRQVIPSEYFPLESALSTGDRDLRWAVIRDRCFLTIDLHSASGAIGSFTSLVGDAFIGGVAQAIMRVIHLPGLRGNPERTYPVSAIGPIFPGTFEKYTASLITAWQEENDTRELERLISDLRLLGLTAWVEAVRVNDTQVELRVGRVARTASKARPELVKIHWFTRRDRDGHTEIRSADLDRAGAFGDWPEDFADVRLDAESRYLDAAEAVAAAL